MTDMSPRGTEGEGAGAVSPGLADEVSPARTGGVPRRSALQFGVAAVVGAASIGAVAGCANSGSRTPRAPAPKKDTAVIALDAVAVGGSKSVMIDRQPAVVARPDEESVVAFSAICTHQGCTVNPTGAKLVCPCHGSQFDAFTGEVLRGPAERPLPAIPVRADGDEVVTD